MRQIFSMAVVALSAAAIASGQQQVASGESNTVVEQVIRKLDNERIQAQIHADVAGGRTELRRRFHRSRAEWDSAN
jgi:hypothetical protein